jgi:putative transposase
LATFIHNHASAIVACDLFTSVTATFQVLYVFVAIEIGSRRILHGNVTDHPNADWTRQQFREFLDGESGHRYLIHDRDSVFSVEVDAALKGFGLKVLKTPVRSPMANAHCERVIGSIRRECLDYLIPLNERHLKRVLSGFITLSFAKSTSGHNSLSFGENSPFEWRPSYCLCFGLSGC